MIGIGAAVGVFLLLYPEKDESGLPNLLLITMDTTRADHLGCYGYSGARTPAIDDLAGRGVTFRRFFSNVPLTLPSHTTIMTGLYPPEHGCRVNGGCRLTADIPTLAEVFSSHGYRTGAFVAAFVLDRKFGLDRGFDDYDDYQVPNADDIYDENAMYRYRRADRVADAALAWLEKHAGEPFFCWVHFFDPHRPYYFSPAPGEGLSGAYDREIAFMDSQIGRLTDFLRKRGLREKTVIIALGDHGEGLGDHGEEEHGLLLYNSVLRVPLIVSGPGTGSGRTNEALLASVDLFPTILDVFGWGPPGGISGRSFAPGLAGDCPSDEDVYLETEFPFTEYGWSPLAALISVDWKYIAAPREELYNLRADPGEKVNLAATNSDTARQLKKKLEKISGEMARRKSLPASLEDRERGLLASLGYLGGEGGGRREQGMLRDPKDVIGLRREFIAAVEQIHRGQTAAAEEKLRDLVEKSPESYTFRFRLARLLYEEGRLEEAAEGFRSLTAAYPDEFKTHYNLGKTLNQLKRYNEAIAELQLALELDPGQTAALNNLGIAFLRTGRTEQAMETFRRSIGLDDRQVDPHNNLGNALMARGRIREAAGEFARSVEIDPDFFEGHYNRGLCLLRLGEAEKAAQAFREAVRLRPGFQPARRNLAIALRGE